MAPLKSKSVKAAAKAAASAPSGIQRSSSTSHITVKAQQSRFHAATLESATEVDVHDLDIAVGERDLIVGAHLKLKAGTRYALVGRNGTGKSTLLTALAKKLIPGLGRQIRILLLSQVDDAADAVGKDLADSESAQGQKETVLEHVQRGDVARTRALADFALLNKAIESASPAQVQRALNRLRLAKAGEDLDWANDLAARRSGARGWDARGEQLKAEEAYRQAQAKVDQTDDLEVDADVMDQALAMMTDMQLNLDSLEASRMQAEAAMILAGLGFTTEMQAKPFTSLSGGWRSRCLLATSLLVKSDVLLLDEPSNFLDLDATLWLERYLVASDRTLVVTSHDQDFLEHVVQETILIRKNGLRYFDGTPRAYEVNEWKQRKNTVSRQEAMAKKKEHIEKSIQQGMASAKKTGDDNRLRMVKSRQKKLDDRWGVEQSAKGTRFKLNRDLAGYHLTSRAELELEEVEPPIKINLPDPDPLRTAGDLVHFDNVSFAYPKAKKATLEGVTFTVAQSGRCSFIGANGEGKSTLAKLILGKLKPTSGNIVKHPLMKNGYFSQHSVEELTNAPATMTSALTGAVIPTTALSFFMHRMADNDVKVDERDARACLGSLGLQGKTAAETPLKALSGGQKVRLAFALIIFNPPHLLLLDEITTHVDAPTIRGLALALRHFAGGIILVTHDRWFNRVVIEGVSPKEAFDEPLEMEDDDSEESEASDEESAARKGQTWRVGKGKIRLTEGGMTQYIGIVEKRIDKKMKEMGVDL